MQRPTEVTQNLTSSRQTCHVLHTPLAFFKSFTVIKPIWWEELLNFLSCFLCTRPTYVLWANLTRLLEMTFKKASLDEHFTAYKASPETLCKSSFRCPQTRWSSRLCNIKRWWSSPYRCTLGSRSRGYHPVAPKPIAAGPLCSARHLQRRSASFDMRYPY
jgi:hypothetical protein